jgi:hypothetical protein
MLQRVSCSPLRVGSLAAVFCIAVAAILLAAAQELPGLPEPEVVADEPEPTVRTPAR